MAQSALATDQLASPPTRLRVLGPAAGGGDPTQAARAPVPQPRLELPPYDLQAALGLERELGVSHVLAQILVRRGFSEPQAACAFLDGEERHLPSAFTGLDRALAAIDRRIADRSPITIHGDYDVDGVAATAVLVRALRSLGATVDWFIPDRVGDGYGLSRPALERLAERGTRLLITADCGITAVEEVAAARSLGIEVVITDHHQPRPDGALPDCPIIHPAVCGYPCREVCGTAVAHKLAEALGADTVVADLELVALATVADLMPLQGENRRLVREGLLALGRTIRPGLRALMEVSGCDPSALDAAALGFRLAPRINAAGRLRRADAGIELLLTTDARRASEIARELDLVNVERRAVEERILWEAEAQVCELGERSGYVLGAEGWHPGVIGIVASRIAERYHRPTVLVALTDAGGQGSARSIPGFDLLGALHACAPHLGRYGGHRAAAGLSLDRDRLEAFAHAFDEHAAAVLSAELLVPVERVDAVVSGSELGLELVEELERLEPTGMANPAPRLLIAGARFRDVRPMGEGRHARFHVLAAGTRAPAVAFGCGGRLAASPDEPTDATFRLERNCWNGTVAPRLVLRQAWPCEPQSIDVIGEPDDYLPAVLEELALDLGDAAPTPARERATLDRRGEGPLAVLADALASGSPLLAVCADVPRRHEGLASRRGGYSLVAYHALERIPQLIDGFPHVVALDPPSCGAHEELLRSGEGFTHLAWGEAELRFAQQMHELEYGLRASLVALYRAIRVRERVAGEELEHLLRGEGPHGRPARLAARLIKVLAELGLVSLDPALPTLAVGDGAPTALDRSPSYRAYAKRYEDGRRFLHRSANPLVSV
ncbi:MAG TPA: single-stranded-DNA-specific exonuclease RecJ [Solirubrobacteraceae bacterium]|nr:single-stranded-DNA-specific exonuclease RecJ [Solirubrobacteraceae bacterium]